MSIDRQITCPEHWVRQVALATLPPLDPYGGAPAEQHARHEAAIRRQLDAVWAEAYHAGATWWAARELPLPVPVVVSPTELLHALNCESLIGEDCDCGVDR